MIKRMCPVVIAAMALAGCASSRTVPLDNVGEGPYQATAQSLERRLEAENKNAFECQVKPDTLIVCDGAHRRIR